MKNNIKTIMVIAAIILAVTTLFCAKTINVYAEDSNTIAVENWTYKFEGSNWVNAPSSPIIAGDYVIVFSGKSIYKFSIKDGTIIASNETGYTLGFGIIAPIVDAGQKNIYMAFNDGIVACFNFEDLSTTWVYHDAIGGQCNSPLLLYRNTLYTGFWKGEKKDANFVAINASTGDKKWTFTKTGGFYWAGGVIIGDKIVIGSDDGIGSDNGNADGVLGMGSVYALSLLDGKVIDSFNVVGDQRCQITYLRNRNEILLTSKGGYLYSVLIRDDGKFEMRGSIELKGGQSTSQPKVYNGRIYVCSGNGINKSGFVEVIDLGTLKRIYYIESEYYPQCGVGLVPQDDSVDVYYNYNGYPGGIRKFTDSQATTSNIPIDYYIPDESKQQYCIGHIFIQGDKLVYKNDSNSIFCLNINKSSGEIKDDNIEFDTVNNCTLQDLLTLIRADIDSLETINIYKKLLSAEFEYGKNSDYYITLNILYCELIQRDEIINVLNEDIKQNCANIHNISLGNRNKIHSIMERYANLSELNKERITGYEDLERAFDKVNTLYFAVILSIVLVIIAIILVVVIFYFRKRRKKAKAALAMPESDE